MECQDLPTPRDPRLYYEHACLTNSLLTFMGSMGFAAHECRMQNEAIREQNCHFAKNDIDLQFVLSSFA